MKTELKCCCGASATFIDERGSYLNDGGKTDEKGRKFLIQRDADAWLDRHDGCLTRVPKTSEAQGERNA